MVSYGQNGPLTICKTTEDIEVIIYHRVRLRKTSSNMQKSLQFDHVTWRYYGKTIFLDVFLVSFKNGRAETTVEKELRFLTPICLELKIERNNIQTF